MAVLYFTGDQVAYFGGVNDTGTATEFTSVTAPFLASDIVEIEIPDEYIDANGEIDPNYVEFSRVTVIRDGTPYDFGVAVGSKIKESGGGSNKEQGDTFFSTNSSVDPPASGPFSGLDPGKMVFAANATFTTGSPTTIERTQDVDFNEDTDTTDPGETGDANFNVQNANTPICLSGDTLILTPRGERRMDSLRTGDEITLADGRAAPIRWITSRRRVFVRSGHIHKPILIKAGALGPGVPHSDLAVSPQHRILLSHAALSGIVGSPEAFARAKGLVGRRGVRQMKGCRAVHYHNLLLDRHAVILANGAEVESLYPGEYGLTTLVRAQRAAIERLFPGVASDVLASYGPTAAPSLTMRQIAKLLTAAKADPIQPAKRYLQPA